MESVELAERWEVAFRVPNITIYLKLRQRQKCKQLIKHKLVILPVEVNEAKKLDNAGLYIQAGKRQLRRIYLVQSGGQGMILPTRQQDEQLCL